MFKNRLIRRVFAPEREEGYEELHKLYAAPSIIRVIKSRRMRRVRHVAHMGNMRNA
jgi:hypothetical protein